ncbi:MAG: tetratricopeptide repeat protein [Acidobacteriaceae bacterium]
MRSPVQMKRMQKKLAADKAWFGALKECLRRRHIAEGMKLLDRAEEGWRALEPVDQYGAEVLLMLAQWVDVGYREPHLLRERLDALKGAAREAMGVSAYVRVRMAEAFYALSTNDADGAIRILGGLLQMEDVFQDAELKALANLWKGRAHRKKADYDMARENLQTALQIAYTMPGSEALVAIIKIQQAWIVFQHGDSAGALQMLDEAEGALKATDHWIALGNIESARGRIVRRHGDYARAVTHFERAVALYEISHPQHTNLARAMTNLSFVKRLLAAQLKKHIDVTAARKSGKGEGKAGESRLREFHRQYQELYRSAILELERAKEICMLHGEHAGLGSALLNAGYLHLDVGDLGMASREAAQALEIAEDKHNVVLKARACTLMGMIENARVEELLGSAEEIPNYARLAKQHCMEAVALGQSMENKRVLLNAYVALGETAANNFFHDYELAQRCVDAASALLEPEDADYAVDELNALKARLLKVVGIEDTLRAWSQGIITGRSFQEVTEQFAQLVIPRVWMREECKISRVAKKLAMSPQKVRRLVKRSSVMEGVPVVRKGKTTHAHAD